MLYEYISGLNLKALLRYEDRNSMRFSIESRVPLADDHNLIEYVFKIPSSYKIYQGWSKNLLREAVKNKLPKKITWRKDKIGFMTPEHTWLQDNKDEIKKYFTKDLNEYLDVDKFINEFDENLKNPTDKKHIWRFINFAVWKKVYNL